MTPEDLALIAADGAVVDAAQGQFSSAFYATLFELAPATRGLFPDDLVAQRGKLVDELRFLVDAAVGTSTSHDLGPFVERARDLGRRHVSYGVTSVDFAPVGAALTTALSTCVEGWDDAHEHAWSALFRLIADAMLEGAATVGTSGG